jgi:hypothetical protein
MITDISGVLHFSQLNMLSIDGMNIYLAQIEAIVSWLTSMQQYSKSTTPGN